jgi:hypothetical protein
MARLTFKKETTPAHSLELRPGVNRLGRRPDNDFQIDDPTVSSVHCELRVNGDSIVVRDLGSSNGTFINGQQVREGTLGLGETLALGEVELTLQPTEVSVSIPKWEEPKAETSPRLANGSEACMNHPLVAAMQRCTHCKRVFCNTCIHHLRRAGGRILDLCPACSHPCELLPGVIKPRKRSLFARLQETLKFSMKR